MKAHLIKTLNYRLTWLLITAFSLGCTEHQSNLSIPEESEYSTQNHNFRLVAVVIPPAGNNPNHTIRLAWQGLDSESEFSKPTRWSIERRKGCLPQEFNNNQTPPETEFTFEFYASSAVFQSRSFLDESIVELDTCYTYQLEAGIYKQNYEGAAWTMSVKSIYLAVPVGNAGFYR